MAYKTILLCLNEIARLPQLIAVARQLGVKFNAHISGLYVIPGVQIYPSAGYGAGPDIHDGSNRFFKKHLPEVQQKFETAMKQDKLSFDLHVVDASHPLIVQDVISNCRNADLVIVSNTNRDDVNGVEYDFVERFVLAAGRPVLVLPYKGDVTLKTDQVLIAWNETREATRAVFDALPFLQEAKEARIVTVDLASLSNMPGATLAESLDRHGVKTEVTNLSSESKKVGDMLLRAAHDYGADMVVMGAYGHSRFSEMIFGGATHDMLRKMDRPVLMSH
jgi:nucleotide-binding universal stress UspA family protein